MDPAQLFTASRVLIVAGKGGVGKTTVSAALARAAADVGLDVLFVELEGKSGVGSLYGTEPLDYRETVLSRPSKPGAGTVWGRALTADEALLEYLEDHGLSRLARRLVASGALELVAAATPGIKDVLVLGKIKQLSNEGKADVVIVDAPAAGHAIQFLNSASGIIDAVAVGPIHAQARDVLAMLSDPRRCQVVLVTHPEETPVNELIQTAYDLEDRVGVSLGPVVVNGAYPSLPGLGTSPEKAAELAGVTLSDADAEALAAAAAFRRSRLAIQAEQVERLAAELPLPQLVLPFLFTTHLGAGGLDTLVSALLDGVRMLDHVPHPVPDAADASGGGA